MDRISQSFTDVKEHVKGKFECTHCCTLMCWALFWIVAYSCLTCIMVILVACQMLLTSETFELFPRKSNVPYFMIGMILLQCGAIIIYSLSINEESDKGALIVMIYLIVLSVVFVSVAIMTQFTNIMAEEETLSDAKFLHAMRYHFHSSRYMSFWVTFQKNYECCGVNNWKDWREQTKTMVISGGCCRSYSSVTTQGMVACEKYGMRYGVAKGCSRKLHKSRPFQVSRLALLLIAISLALMHIPGIIMAFVLKRRFYVLYYLDYGDDDSY